MASSCFTRSSAGDAWKNRKFASWSRKAKSDRSMDSSRRKRGTRSPPNSSWCAMRKPGNGKPNTISATTSISAQLNRSGPIPPPARSCAKSARTTFCARKKTASGNRPFGFRASCASAKSLASRSCSSSSRARLRSFRDSFPRKAGRSTPSSSAPTPVSAGNFRRARQRKTKTASQSNARLARKSISQKRTSLAKAKCITASSSKWKTPTTCASPTRTTAPSSSSPRNCANTRSLPMK